MLPLFKSHYSIGKSILTLSPDQSDSDNSGPDSIIKICQDNNLEELILLEDQPIGFLEARKHCMHLNIKLIFGLRFNIASSFDDDESKKNSLHKVAVFAKNSQGSKDLNFLYTKIYSKMGGTASYEVLSSCWSKNLMLAIPFYDSFLHMNACSFSTCIPDLKFTEPVFFLESNGLPIDNSLSSIIKDYCRVKSYQTLKSKSIFYKNRSDLEAFQTYKCICNRSFGRKQSLSKPGFDGLGSREFCFESWKELASE